MFDNVIKFWSEWQLQALVSLSFILQVILISFGSKRKHTASFWPRILVWLSYLSADWIAVYSLGVLNRSETGSITADVVLQSFWAPFLLLHLGGPGTITSYSLEDNQLWVRHLLGLAFPFGLALFVLFKCWTSALLDLNLLAIVVFVVGTIKCAERTLALRAAINREAKATENLSVSSPYRAYERKTRRVDGPSTDSQNIIEDAKAKMMNDAYRMFPMLMQVFQDTLLGTKAIRLSSIAKQYKSAEEAFTLAEIGLGFLYDTLHTKASIVCSKLGSIIRSLCTISLVSTLLIFEFEVDKRPYTKINKAMTYVLLGGAVFLEIYGAIQIIFSDWGLVWLSRSKGKLPWAKSVFLFVCNVTNVFQKRWSGSASQIDLLDFCLKETKAKVSWWRSRVMALKCISISERMKLYLSLQKVPSGLKEFIFKQLWERIEAEGDMEASQTAMCKHIFDKILTSHGILNILDDFFFDPEKTMLPHSDKNLFGWTILTWHIGTNLCFYAEYNGKGDQIQGEAAAAEYRAAKYSKLLSDYMVYILLTFQDTLPVVTGDLEITIEEIRNVMVKNFDERNASSPESLMMWRETDGYVTSVFASDGVRTSAIIELGRVLGCRLHELRLERKWEVITKIWVAMLSYTAVMSQWKKHARQLTQGGELLSHVRVLLLYYGLSRDYTLSAAMLI